MRKRAELYERMIRRFIDRYKEYPVKLYCSNGSISIEAYKARPAFLEDSDSVRRVVAGYEWIITAKTFKDIKRLTGTLFDDSIRIEADGELYRLDRQTPYQSIGLEAGYRLFSYKVNESEKEE